tara:strand:- start:550 stop:777 length:228 start_codon:yes stop_codon:yes gene_type:complete
MTELRIPAAGDSVTELQIVEWIVETGTSVTAGEMIYTVESDKSVLEIEAPVAGTLTIIEPAGEIYDVGHLVGRID